MQHQWKHRNLGCILAAYKQVSAAQLLYVFSKLVVLASFVKLGLKVLCLGKKL